MNIIRLRLKIIAIAYIEIGKYLLLSYFSAIAYTIKIVMYPNRLASIFIRPPDIASPIPGVNATAYS